MEAAQSLAKRAIENGDDETERLTYAFRACLTRAPESDELDELRQLLARQKAYIGEGWINPSELATGKSEVPKKLPGKVTPTELAAYTVAARVLLNLDETISKE